jgi:hypothetical protein
MGISAANPMRSGEFTFEPTRLFNPAYFRYRVQESHEFGPLCLFPKMAHSGYLSQSNSRACHRDRHQNCKLLEIKDLKGVAERVEFNSTNYMKIKFCGATWPSKVLKRKERNP